MSKGQDTPGSTNFCVHPYMEVHTQKDLLMGPNYGCHQHLKLEVHNQIICGRATLLLGKPIQTVSVGPLENEGKGR